MEVQVLKELTLLILSKQVSWNNWIIFILSIYELTKWSVHYLVKTVLQYTVWVWDGINLNKLYYSGPRPNPSLAGKEGHKV